MTATPTLGGKRALVTGASRGIGAAIVRRLACQGATVAVNYRSDRPTAHALVDELTDQAPAGTGTATGTGTGTGTGIAADGGRN